MNDGGIQRQFGVSLWDFVHLKEEKWEDFLLSLADNKTNSVLLLYKFYTNIVMMTACCKRR